MPYGSDPVAQPTVPGRQTMPLPAGPQPLPTTPTTAAPAAHGYGTDPPATGSAPRVDTLTPTEPAPSYLIPPFPKVGFPGVQSPFTGPSIFEQQEQQKAQREARQKELGRPLTPSERLEVNPLEESPLLGVGFGTREIGGAGMPEMAGAIARQRAVTEIAPDITHAIRPTVSGRLRRGQTAQLNTDIRGTVERIIDNSQNLQYRDPSGAVIASGRDPETLGELAEAIEQTKRNIWQRVTATAQAAHQAGANVDTYPIYQELTRIANSQEFRLNHPEMIPQVQALARRWLNQGSLTIPEAQEQLAHFNAILKPFYNNPTTFEVFNWGGIYRSLANVLRPMVDSEVDAVLGNAGYQDLRDQYASLARIEPAVNKAAGVEARNQPHGGRGGVTGAAMGVLGWEEIIRGLGSMVGGHFDVVPFLTGAALHGGRALLRHQRAPATAIQRAFRYARQARTTPPRPFLRPGYPVPALLRQDQDGDRSSGDITSYINNLGGGLW